MRLFLALALPAAVCTEIARAQTRLRDSCTGWRWVRPEGIHLTLRFLGEVSGEDDEAFRPRWRRVAAGAAPLRVRIVGVGVFPGPRSPRVLWFGVREEWPGGALTALAVALEDAARALGFRPGARPFHPHLTVARASRDTRASAPFVDVGDLGEASFVEVVLFRSELGRDRTHYTALEAFPLEARPSP